MEKHLDFTIDFETCSLSANAAVMQVAVVPWLRDGEKDPFIKESELAPFVAFVDLRTCVVDGFDFDPATVRWWARQSDGAKAAVTGGTPEPIHVVLAGLLSYIEEAVGKYELTSICLWCQGPDVDIAILRNLCEKYGRALEDFVPHTSFRDCRTMILESAIAFDEEKAKMYLEKPHLAYPTYTGVGEAHDALYDAIRSSWSVWCAMRWLKRMSERRYNPVDFETACKQNNL